MSNQETQLREESKAKRVKVAHRKSLVDHGYRVAMQAPKRIPAVSLTVKNVNNSRSGCSFEIIPPHNACVRNIRVQGVLNVQVAIRIDNVLGPADGEPIFQRGRDFAQNDRLFHRMLNEANIRIGARNFKYGNIQQWLTEHLRLVGSRTDNDKFKSHADFLSLYACNNDSNGANIASTNTTNEQSGDNVPNGAWPVLITDINGNEFAAGNQTYTDEDGNVTDVVNRQVVRTDERTTFKIYCKIPFDEPLIFEPLQSGVFRKFGRMRFDFKFVDVNTNAFRPLVNNYINARVQITAITPNNQLNLLDPETLQVAYLYDNVMPKIQKSFLYMDPSPPTFQHITNANLEPGASREFQLDVRFQIYPHDRTFIVLYAKSILNNLFYSENPYRLVITNVELRMNNKDSVYLRYTQSQLFEESLKNNNVPLSYNVQRGTIYVVPSGAVADNGFGERQSMGSLIVLALPQKQATGMQEVFVKVTVQNVRSARQPAEVNIDDPFADFVPRTETNFDLVAWTYTKQRIMNTDDMNLIKLKGESMTEEKMIPKL